MSRLLCLFGVASDLVNQLAHPLIFPSFVLVFMGIDAIQGAPLSVRSWGELISYARVGYVLLGDGLTSITVA